ncbi:MAG: hypothetical protein ACRDIY_02335 [Chloroflexota bacterium]
MKRMTVIFEDEGLYTAIKVEAARRNRALKDLVTEAVREWLANQEDLDLLPILAAARKEWREKGGIEASEFFRKLEEDDRASPRAVSG